MKTSNKSTGDVELASNFRVSDYENARNAKNAEGKKAIADAIQRRFLKRYIKPVTTSRRKHGFATMAVSCLMIEALESFRQGQRTTKGKSQAAFCSFFETAAPFSMFKGHAKEFYEHVRCGILHQAETTGGWVILRRGPLFDPDARTINATKFIRELETFLKGFCADLKTRNCDSAEWKHVITKMNAIVENCQA